MKKRILSALAFAAPFAVLAEGESGGSGPAGISVLSDISSSLSSFMTAAIPIITGLVTAGIALWAAFALVPLVKRAWKMFTGR